MNELKRVTTAAARSRWEDRLAFDLRALGLSFEREFIFHPTRRWRFDFAFPSKKLAIEIDGGIFTGGRHTRGTGVLGDMEKFAEALVLGWRVLRVAPQHVRSGAALRWLLAIFPHQAAA